MGNIVGMLREGRDDPAPNTRASAIVPTVSAVQRAMPEGFLTGQIDLQDRIPEKKRVGQPGYVHASSLIDGCSREHVIANLTGTEINEYVSGSDRVVWAQGRATEKHVRDQVIAAAQRRGIYGKWTCHCPKTFRKERVGFYDGKPICQRCEQHLDRYAEVTLLDHESKVSGNPDLVLRFSGLFLPVEIKSMKMEEFQTLRHPRGDHVSQALMYRYLLALDGKPVHDNIIVFYVSKGYSFRRKDSAGKHPIYREFHVNANDPAYDQTVQTMLEKAREIRDYIAAGTYPPRTVCDSPTCQRAKYKCGVTGTCFSL